VTIVYFTMHRISPANFIKSDKILKGRCGNHTDVHRRGYQLLRRHPNGNDAFARHGIVVTCLSRIQSTFFGLTCGSYRALPESCSLYRST